MSLLLLIILQVVILAYAIVGGVFLTFSDFIMRALAQTGKTSGAQTMQSINREVFRWIFMALFLGLAPASLVLAVCGLFFVENVLGSVMLLAGLIYFLGCFLVTVFCNVPMNEALSRMDADTGAAKSYWSGTYLPRWTFWNSVRTLACVVASAPLLFGLVLSMHP